MVFSFPFTCRAVDAREANGKLDLFVAQTCATLFGGSNCEEVVPFTEEDALDWPMDAEAADGTVEFEGLAHECRRFLAELILHPAEETEETEKNDQGIEPG